MAEQRDVKSIIQDELINDYYTAGIKAEVILDMLLRPVLEKTLGQLLGGEDQEVRFITKEFPIPTTLPTKANDNHNLTKEFPIPTKAKANDNHNCNVDYLMHDNDYVYLIELKTSSTSEDKKQLENYIEHIYKKGNRGKSFRELFGERFIWMLNHVSASGIGDEWKKIEDKLGYIPNEEWKCLKNLFDQIISFPKKGKTILDKDTYSQKAIEYLKNSGKTGSAKYIFQAGQILDSDPEIWWGKPVRLVYIVPNEKDFREKLKRSFNNINTTVNIKAIEVIEIKDIRKQLDDSNEYEKMLRSILEDIFDFKETKNAND